MLHGPRKETLNLGAGLNHGANTGIIFYLRCALSEWPSSFLCPFLPCGET